MRHRVSPSSPSAANSKQGAETSLVVDTHNLIATANSVLPSSGQRPQDHIDSPRVVNQQLLPVLGRGAEDVRQVGIAPWQCRRPTRSTLARRTLFLSAVLWSLVSTLAGRDPLPKGLDQFPLVWQSTFSDLDVTNLHYALLVESDAWLLFSSARAVTRLDGWSGNKQWQRPLDYEESVEPTLARKTVVLAANLQEVVGLSSEKGLSLWTRHVPGPVRVCAKTKLVFQGDMLP